MTIKKEGLYMKKTAMLLLVMLLTIALVGCAEPISNSSAHGEENDTQSKVTDVDETAYDLAADAVKVLKKAWAEHYSSDYTGEGYLEIIHTRVIEMKDTANDTFKDIAYIVEFELLSDYYESAPYYQNAHTNNTVVVRKDGTKEISPDLLRYYATKTYSYDFSPFIQEIYDLDDTLNAVYLLK